MRVSRETAEKNRKNVVRAASQEFRKHGYDGIGIVGLMKAAGMTQGGFYKQFKDKRALEAEATELALQENFESWTKAMAGSEDPISALKNWYLSEQHLQAVAQGCTYAALASEVTRERPALHDAFNEAVERQIEQLAKADNVGVASRKKAIQSMAQMIGTLILARSVSDTEIQQEILAAGKSQ